MLLQMSQKLLLFTVILLLSSLAFIIALSQKRQEIRQHAAVNGNWITRVGSSLFLNGQPFRFAGTNEYWLAHFGEENRFPTNYEIDDGIRTAQQMGATVVRSFALTSVGCSDCIEPQFGKFNPQAFSAFDYALVSAREHNIHFILPLLSDHDGKPFYNSAVGLPTSGRGEDQFFTNATILQDYEKRISFILNHVNPLTGLAYKDDPTIMAWETGNEMQSWWDASTKSEHWSYDNWTKSVADYIKSIDQQHLIADGHSGLIGAQTHPDAQAVQIASIDMYSDHSYPMESQYVIPDAALVASAGKVFFIGEYDWAGKFVNSPGPTPLPVDSLSQFLTIIKNTNAIAGDLFWDVFPHSYSFGFVRHQEGLTLHYTGSGQSSDWRTNALALRNHGFIMQGVPIPTSDIPDTPLLNQVTQKANSNVITWRGVVGADSYTLQRSGDNGTSWVTIGTGLTDDKLPYIDANPTQVSYLYRVQAINIDGVPGNFSDANSTPTPSPTILPSPSEGVTPTPSPAQGISFSLTLCPHGLGNCGDSANPVGGNTSPAHQTKTIHLTIANLLDIPVATFDGTVTYQPHTATYQGTIAASSLPPSSYLLSVKMDGFLTKRYPDVSTITGNQSVILPELWLVTGDIAPVPGTNGEIYGDNQLDITDYNVLINCYGQKINTSSCLNPPTTQNAGADLTDDGVIDGSDYNLFVRELSVQQGE